VLKVVFMGTPEFAVPALESVHAAFKILGVYTQPDKPVGRGQEMRFTPVKKKALEFGLRVFQPEKLSQPGVFEELSALQPDIIVVVAFGQILRTNVLRLARLGCFRAGGGRLRFSGRFFLAIKRAEFRRCIWWKN
jgi:methionyl-tRNA formyltransferase